MNILLVSSEVVPFAKTGGLADVSAALPAALTRLGVNSAVVMPAYRKFLERTGVTFRTLDVVLEIPIGSKVVTGGIIAAELPGTQVPIYFIDQPAYFDRPELYRERGADYKDNCERFVFFCRSVMEMIRLLDLPVDIIHCNDWQSGLIPAYQRCEYQHARGYEHILTLMTIHNLAYQGRFWHWDMLLTGLDWRYFNWKQMEFYGDLNLLKTGIVFADAISTVSQRYSEEIQTSEHGCGLEGVLQQRREVLSGIINGVDYDIWNPEVDAQIPAKYSVQDWQTGKRICKAGLQAAVGLTASPTTPLIGLVGRLADQKGFDLVADIMKRWVHDVDCQWVIVGTGEPVYHDLLTGLAREHPGRVAVKLEFSERLAHLVEAGADMFLMPSRYEPCGLNQMYSLRYGTVPIVRETGGLADTVVDLTEAHLTEGTANGFSFLDYDASALEATLRRAVSVFQQQPDTWRRIVEIGMRQDWSWDSSARRYIELFHRMLAARDL
ncbi:MAG: glycogen synthase GlgA, partial [Pirellulaceae bacterium]